jgi:hypothetical protein
MYRKMAEQAGISGSSTALGIEPKYIVTCPALRGTVLALLQSTSDPASNNSGVKNIWENGLQPVFEAQLGATFGGSDTAWYLFSDYRDVDTLEYAYLRGLETPALDQERAFGSLAIRYRIYQAFATAAIDYRGIQHNAGV